MQIVQVPLWLFVVSTIALLVCLLIQAGILLALGLAGLKALKKAEALADTTTTKVLPILEQVRFILEDLAPKVRAVTTNVVEISATARDQAKHVNTTVDEVVEKTRGQAARVDEMVSAALNGVAHAATTLQEGVKKPARRVGNIIQDFRSKVEEFRAKRQSPSAEPAAPHASSYEYRSGVVGEDLDTANEAATHRPAV